MTEPSCDNCDINPVSWKCLDCENNFYFCYECYILHKKVKAFRGHTLQRYQLEKAVVPKCSNCDVEESNIRCLDCDNGSNFFCKECGNLHIKIKANRDHQILNLEQESNNGNPNKPLVIKFVLNIFKRFQSILTSLGIPAIDLESYPMIYSLLIAILVQGISRFLFGGTRLSIIGLVIVGGYLYNRNKPTTFPNIEKSTKFESTLSSPNKSRISSPVKPLDDSTVFRSPGKGKGQSVLMCDTANNFPEDESLNGEFWHEKSPDPTRFRPRTREYIGRIDGKTVSKNLN
eukprot:gene11113-23223_t